jgi:glycosyltransferase involved in cell wall biosynthesis
VPIIASDLPGVRELVRLLGGALVPPKDSDALARTLETVLDDSTPQAPKAIPIERFLWQNVARTYLKCYGKITGLESGTELLPVQPMKGIEQIELVQ